MELVSIGLLLVGTLLLLVGAVGFLIASFRASIWWGLGCLFLPFVPLLFLIIHWRMAFKPFRLQVIGFLFCLIGSFLSPTQIVTW